MAAVALDSIDYAHQLEAAGMPRQQAEVVAKGLTTMLVHNFDALATKDLLDSRFSEFETRIVADMDTRFSKVDTRFSKVDTHFSKVDQRFTEIRAEMAELRGELFAEMVALKSELRGEMAEIRATLKLQSWISAVLVAGVFIPLLQKLVA